MTVHVDLTAFTGFGNEQFLIEALLVRFQSRISDPRLFALQSRILLLQDATGAKIDVSLGAVPYEQRMMGRSSPWEISSGLFLRTCSAEDLVILKAFANRERDWTDVDRILVRQGAKLDPSLIRDELEQLAQLKDDAAIVRQLEQLFRKRSIVQQAGTKTTKTPQNSEKKTRTKKGKGRKGLRP